MTGFTDNDDKSKSPGSFNEGDTTSVDKPNVFLQVGDRVFSTAEEVAKHVAASQAHITKLEAEAKEQSDQISKAAAAADDNVSMREILEGLKNANQSQKAPDTPAASKEEVIAEAVAIATQRVSENLKTENQKKLEDDNLAVAMELAEEKYGDDFKGEVIKVGKDHGLTGDQVNNLAKTSPIAFQRLFIPVVPSGNGPAEGDLNTQAFNQQPGDTNKVSFMRMSKATERADEVTRRIQAKQAQG